MEVFYPVRVVKRPSFSTFILKSSLVYVEGGLHAEFEVWEYSDTAYAMENAHRVKHQTLWKDLLTKVKKKFQVLGAAKKATQNQAAEQLKIETAASQMV